ncbi:MAG: hypothetical protein IH988_06675, partial [Planctomycetes bacterium]|nr:hypothetical protein [Planctomycetota bacterium]
IPFITGIQLIDQDTSYFAGRLKRLSWSRRTCTVDNAVCESLTNIMKIVEVFKENPKGTEADGEIVAAGFFDMCMGGMQDAISELLAEINDLDERTANLRFEAENLYIQTATIEINVSRLDNEIEVLSKNSATLAQRLQDALIAKAEQGGVIRVVQSAVQPETPVARNRLRNISLAAVLGLFLGVTAALIVSSFQGSRSSDEEH